MKRPVKKIFSSSLSLKQFLAILLLCFFIGVAYSVASAAVTQAAQASSDDQNKDLIDLITKLDGETEALEQEITEARERLANSEGTYGKDAATVEAMRQQMESLQLLAGQTEVTGPGVILTLNDNTSGAEAARQVDPENFVAENYIIHDTDLRYLLNDIAYLAEAVAINNQRIVSVSDIRCVGTVIMVNSTRLAPPYEIQFIGPAKMLEAAINESAQYQYLKSKGMPMKISAAGQLTLPAYSGSLSYDYMQPYTGTNTPVVAPPPEEQPEENAADASRADRSATAQAGQ